MPRPTRRQVRFVAFAAGAMADRVPRATRARPNSAFLVGALVVGAVAVAGLRPATPERAMPATRMVSGTLSTSNSRDGSAVLTAANIGPGDQATGTVQVGNDGDLAGDFTLALSHLSDSPGPLGGRLSSRLRLSVQDITGSGAGGFAYSGPLDEMAPLALGMFKPGEVRTYRFTVTFPDGGTADNGYRDSTASVQFDWTATGDDSGQDSPSPPGSDGTPPPPGEPPSVSPPTGDQAPTPAPPLLTITARGTQRPLRQRGVVATVRCRIACVVTGVGRITGPHRARSARAITLSRAHRRLRAGASAKLKFTLTRRALRATRGALSGHRRISAIISFRATALGATSRATRTIKLRR